MSVSQSQPSADGESAARGEAEPAAAHAGPWFVRQNDASSGQWEIGLGEWELKPGHRTVTGCRGDEYMQVGGICAEADARLMASAPELFDVVAELLRHSVSHYGNPTDETDGVGLVHAKARAAIAKATGQ